MAQQSISTMKDEEKTTILKFDFPEMDGFSAPEALSSGAPKLLKEKCYWKKYFDKKVLESATDVVITKSKSLLPILLSTATPNPGIYAPNILELALQLRTSSDVDKCFFAPALAQFNLDDFGKDISSTREPTLTKLNLINVDANKDQADEIRIESESKREDSENNSDRSTNRSNSYDPVALKIIRSLNDANSAPYIGPLFCCALLGGASRQPKSTSSRILRMLTNLSNFFPTASAASFTKEESSEQNWLNQVSVLTSVLKGIFEYRQFAAVCVANFLYGNSNDGAYKAIRMAALMLYHREGYQIAYFVNRLASRYNVAPTYILNSCGIGSMAPDIRCVATYIRHFQDWVKAHKLQNDDKWKQSYYFCRAVDDEFDCQLSGAITWRLQAVLALWIDQAEGSSIYKDAFETLRLKNLTPAEKDFAEHLFIYYEEKFNYSKGTPQAQEVQEYCKRLAPKNPTAELERIDFVEQ